MFKKQKNNLSLEEELFLALVMKELKKNLFDVLPSTHFFNEIIKKASGLSEDKNFLISILKAERDNFNRLCNEKIKELTKKD